MTLVNQNISHYKLVSQIENLRVAITRDHDVVGFKITMHNAGGVG